MSRLSKETFDVLLATARTANGFSSDPVPDELLHEIWDLARMGPTTANTSPLRVVFVRSAAAKALLRPALMGGNVDKTMSAPVTAIFAYDTTFYDLLPRLFPHADMRPMFAGNAAFAASAGQMNAALQAGYFMLTARGMGLDCGPMGGFDRAMVDSAFFADSTWRSTFLCNLGHGDPSKLFPRSPRLDFGEACKVL